MSLHRGRHRSLLLVSTTRPATEPARPDSPPVSERGPGRGSLASPHRSPRRGFPARSGRCPESAPLRRGCRACMPRHRRAGRTGRSCPRSPAAAAVRPEVLLEGRVERHVALVISEQVELHSRRRRAGPGSSYRESSRQERRPSRRERRACTARPSSREPGTCAAPRGCSVTGLASTPGSGSSRRSDLPRRRCRSGK